MNIGLVDVDNHNFPNIALMKLSAYHKGRGDNVEWANALFGQYDIVYKAKVFTFTPDDDICYNSKTIIRGGTGYDLSSKLPEEVEHMYPDYSLYRITDTAYGYLSRGCPRGCDFCIVKDKEGRVSRKVADLKEFWRGQKFIEIMDPNITACVDFDELMQQVIDSKAWVNFNQGVDIRIMTEHKQEMFNRCKLKMIHFAWDNPKDTITPKLLEKFAGGWKVKQRNRRVYVLTNFNSNFNQDLYRVNTLRQIGYDPYVMIYEKWTAPTMLRRLQRYVNNKAFFWSGISFGEFLKTYKSECEIY